MDEALSRLAADSTDAAANVFVGLRCYIAWTMKSNRLGKGLDEAERYFKVAVESGNLHIYHC